MFWHMQFDIFPHPHYRFINGFSFLLRPPYLFGAFAAGRQRSNHQLAHICQRVLICFMGCVGVALSVHPRVLIHLICRTAAMLHVRRNQIMLQEQSSCDQRQLCYEEPQNKTISTTSNVTLRSAQTRRSKSGRLNANKTTSFSCVRLPQNPHAWTGPATAP